MIALAVIVAIIDDGRVLLTKREDFEVWCLPGGSVEEGESLADAGIREAKEETGLDVELTHLVGVYSRLGGGMVDVHAVLYTAKPVGGELRIQPNETIEVAFFLFDRLPKELLFGHERRIHDAISNASGVSVRQQIDLQDKTKYTREEIYALRDQSGMSRKQFYFQRFEKAEILEVVEVGNT
ncbi:MAG TPA: NUDIX domain-containing protein [Anaerolineales bacterium]|nr:NUDIX domain-containing protein [Anaerolineales bacterium]